jgi:hypothetical protein
MIEYSIFFQMRPSSARSVHYNLHQVQAELRVRLKIANIESFRGYNFRGLYGIIRHFDTVKAPNFGPHRNFEPLFQKGLLSLKRVLQKNEKNKSCRKSLDLQIWFCSFFAYDSSTEATELARKRPKFP